MMARMIHKVKLYAEKVLSAFEWLIENKIDIYSILAFWISLL